MKWIERQEKSYRYMYLKTYAKFTFCIKSQGHVSDESFLYCCMYLASKNFFLRCLKYMRQKDSLLFIVQVFNFFRYAPQNIHGHFQSYFQNDYTQSSEATFAFYCIKLSHYSLSPGFWQSFISIEVCRDCIPALASSCKKQLTGFFVCLLFFLKVKRIS